MMTRQEAMTKILERLAINEDASTDLLDSLMEFPELATENPKVAYAMIKLITIRMESARIIQECKEVLGVED